MYVGLWPAVGEGGVGVHCPGSPGVIGSCKLLDAGIEKQTLAPLEEQYILLTTEPYLQPRKRLC